ncbi:hypothetical protein GCM10007425_21290 [Lysinibacillus alkalisoli]|uniref:Uncharacterized protein n=1 Tax=Lysinibacillus alkalisoli TaxID=1911548 RepID=A0A917G758_9BACI|nr:hypothetical protein [Lysinibacillus alkalisoli]GGG26431.1 hypothetical protein GCM10007425_21290 [Lysinibacillus alkalisoli]
MRNFYLNRIINLNTVEAYFLREGYLISPEYCMILIDYKRPSTIEDFPHLKNINGIPEDEFGDDNFIKAVVVSSKEVTQETYDQLCTVAGGFLEDKEECRWSFVIEIDADFKQKNNLNDIFSLLQKILKKHQYPLNIENIPEEKFNFLSQE